MKDVEGGIVRGQLNIVAASSGTGKSMFMNIDAMQESLGPCPVCGKTKWWLNDVPLAGFCWGTEENEHEEVKIVLQGEFQPYSE